jgi:hypothetical protein
MINTSVDENTPNHYLDLILIILFLFIKELNWPVN